MKSCVSVTPTIRSEFVRKELSLHLTLLPTLIIHPVLKGEWLVFPLFFHNISMKDNRRTWEKKFVLSQKVFSSVARSCPTLCDPMNHSTQASLSITNSRSSLKLMSIDDAIQPSHPLSSPSPPALNPSQHQGLFQWVNSLHEVAKILELQLQH